MTESEARRPVRGFCSNSGGSDQGGEKCQMLIYFESRNSGISHWIG